MYYSHYLSFSLSHTSYLRISSSPNDHRSFILIAYNSYHNWIRELVLFFILLLLLLLLLFVFFFPLSFYFHLLCSILLDCWYLRHILVVVVVFHTQHIFFYWAGTELCILLLIYQFPAPKQRKTQQPPYEPKQSILMHRVQTNFDLFALSLFSILLIILFSLLLFGPPFFLQPFWKKYSVKAKK